MPDQQLDILINFISKQTGLPADQVMKKVTEATKAAGDENERYQQTLEKMRVAQILEEAEQKKAIKWTQDRKTGSAELSKTIADLKENVAKGTKETKQSDKATGALGEAMKSLRQNISHVSRAFPSLGKAGRIFLNPIAIAILGIVAGFKIWKERLTEVADATATASWGTDKINAAAEAMNKYAAGIKASEDSSKLLAANLQKIATFMALIEKLGKASGQDQADNPLAARKAAESKAAQMNAAAAADAEQAAKLRARAKAVDPKASAQYDKNKQAMLDKDAAVAQEKIAALDKEISDLETAYSPENAGLGRYTPEHLKFAARYGAGTNPEDILAQLKNQKGTYQEYVDRAAAGKTEGETNQSRRAAAEALRAKADELDKSAGEKSAAAKETTFQGNVDYYTGAKQQGYEPVVTPNGRGYSVTPDVKAYYDKANADLLAIAQQWSQAIAGMLAQAKQTNHIANQRAGQQ